MARKKSSDEAYDHIQDLILSMKILPGRNVTEHALSKQIGIGRTPVREALARLESEGLIFSNKGRKTVYTLTIKEIKEIFEIKSALEGAIARWAAERGADSDRNKLREILEEMKGHASKRPENEDQRKKYLDEWIELDKNLHKVIFKMAKSPKAQQIIENLNLQWHRTRISVYALEGRILRSSKEHEKFVNHIIQQEGEKAEKAMKSHLKTLECEIENVMRLFNYPV